MLRRVQSVWRSITAWRLACLVLLGLLTVVLGYESRILHRVARKVHARSSGSVPYMGNERTPENLQQIAVQTQQDLFAFRPILHTQGDICRTEHLLRALAGAGTPQYHFSHALLLMGLLEASKNPASQVSQQVLETWCAKVLGEDGKLRLPIRYIDDCSIGYAFCDLYDLTKQDKYRQGAAECADYLLKEYPRNDHGMLPYYREHPEIVLIDDKIVAGFLVRYGEQFDVPEATSLGVKQLQEFLRSAIDPQTGLPMHAYRVTDGRRFGQVGWLRGMGWLCIGLSNALESLPHEHPEYSELRDGFVAILTAARGYQEEGKCWGWAIANPLAHEDTSGTAMLGYAIEKAIAAGVLEPTWSSVSDNALVGVLRATHSDGVVDSALADCNGVGHYANEFGPSNFAQGPATALFARALRRARTAKPSDTAGKDVATKRTP